MFKFYINKYSDFSNLGFYHTIGMTYNIESEYNFIK